MYQMAALNDRHYVIRDLEADMTVAVFLGADAGDRAAARLLDYATDTDARPLTGGIQL